MAARDGPRNLLRLMFDPQGMRPFLADWETVSRSLLQRVQREAVGRVIDDETRQLLDDLLAAPMRRATGKTPPAPAAAPSLPVIPIGFVHEGVVLRYSLVTTVGTPQSAAAQELRMECMFPADDATEARHRQLLDTHAPVR